MTPEEEQQVKDVIWGRMRERMGDEFVDSKAEFLEAQWEYAKVLGMIDPEMDLLP